MRIPDFFIVGAPKCGTTSLARYLEQHPEVFMPQAKDMHFFGKDLDYPPPRITKADYLAYFSEVTTQKRIGEASAFTMCSEVAAEEIKQFNPDAQIIIMLRHPVDMMVSLHSQLKHIGNEDIDDFEQALAAEPDRRVGGRTSRLADLNQALLYRSMATFSVQIQRFLDVFGQDKMHFMILETFKTDPGFHFSELLRFLGVDDTFRPDFSVHNPNTEVRHKWLRFVMRNQPHAIKRLIGTVFPRRTRDRVKKTLWRINTRQAVRQPIRHELQSALRLEFESEIDRLEQLTGCDLSCWTLRDD